jgi:membrane protein
MSVKNTWKILKQSFSDFAGDNILKLSGSLAFSTIFALPGLLIIILWISDFFYGSKAVEGGIYKQIEGFVGHTAAVDIQSMIRTATLAGDSGFATVIGLLALIIGATSVFSEIQDSINYIWRLKAKPRKGKGWLTLILNRLLSFSMVIGLGFILLVSLAINGAMDILIDNLLQRFPDITVIVAYIINLVLTFFITALVFGMIFKVLPDAKVEWKHVRVGAFTTAVFFMLGKFLISYYLGHNRMSSAYGAAGSVIVILLWVYYSSMILYYGAVFTRVYAVCAGTRIYPSQYAVWVEQVEVQTKQPLTENTDVKHQ